ncbi:MAG: Re/Si-specific NAD(P)(+) transhydrogenase subunit alpha [Thermoanaerobaculia bacterium]|nr:Re/Si-specific NAD(P)(+) transhydrogenase subunit alpha [Thermoanaerobaculia bacterium]
MRLFVPKEIAAGERRVAATPETVKKYVKAGLEVVVEAGAGEGSSIVDSRYAEAGAMVVADAKGAWAEADLVVKVSVPSTAEVARMKAGAVLVSFMAPHRNLDVVRKLADARVTSLAMELVPRTTRAQTMDALSSQANIAGYKAVLLAATRLGKYFPLLMTAAGTVPPAKVVIMGAGVAGLQAIATAKRLGAVVEVSDVRAAAKEQVESLGGKFIELPMQESGDGAGGYAKEMSEDFLRKQREIVMQHLAKADVVICTALVPGRKAPILVSDEALKVMRPGAVVVDLAVTEGGNCTQSKADQEVTWNGVHILAPSNLAGSMAEDASVVYSRNVLALVLNFVKDGALALDLGDEINAGSLLTHEGKVTHAATAGLMG